LPYFLEVSPSARVEEEALQVEYFDLLFEPSDLDDLMDEAPKERIELVSEKSPASLAAFLLLRGSVAGE